MDKLFNTKYLQNKKSILKDNSLIENNGYKYIYASETDKVNALEAEIKEVLSREFSETFKKLEFSQEDENNVYNFIKRYLKENKYYFKIQKEYKDFITNIINEIFGLGILEKYIKDETIDEIWIIERCVWYEQYSKRWKSPLSFKNDSIIYSIINKILAPINRKVDELNPLVDARLQDGSRVAVTVSPTALGGPEMNIRKFKKDKFGLNKYVELGSMSQEMADFLKTSVEWGANILVVGGTGSGKTTLLNALTSEVPRNQKTQQYEHIITIEDSAELIVDNPFTQRWETRQSNSEGKGLITASDLVKHSLRNAPDRIILGEIRDKVAYDVLQTAMTGHKGTMSTLHADNAKKAGERFATLAGSSGIVSASDAKKMFASSFDLIVVVERIVFPEEDGNQTIKRAISQIAHIVGYGKEGAEKVGAKNIKADDDNIYYQDIFSFNKRTREFECEGYVPKELITKALFEGRHYTNTFISTKGKKH